LTLLFWTGLTRALDRASRWPAYLGLGLLAGAIALTHQFTFVSAALGATGIVAVRARRLTRRAWLGLGLATAAWLAALLLWPYYSFFALFGVANLDNVNKGVYRQPWMYYGLVAVGLPALWWRFRRARLDPLVVLFLGSLVLVVLGWVTGRYSLGRCWPGVLLAAQLALAVELPGLAAGRWRRVWVPVTGLALALGFVLQAAHLVYALPRSWVPGPLARFDETWPDDTWLTRYVHRGEVLVTDDYYALRTVPAYGIRTIPSAWPDPFLTDQPQRWHDLAVLHEPGVDPAVRQEIIARYHATWVLEFPGKWTMSAGQQPVAVGPRGERLYRIPGTAG
jgi:alpha-1,6-mannosyltransferase